MAKKETNKKVNVRMQRGWDALAKILQERGVKGPELEEARDSFYKGIDLLSRMFLSQITLEKRR